MHQRIGVETYLNLMAHPIPQYLKTKVVFDEALEKIILASPKGKDGLERDLYQYQGIWLTTSELQGAFACQAHFTAQDSDVLLATFPKSGSTWLKALTYALVNRVHHPPPHDDDDDDDNDVVHPLLHNNPHDLVPFLEHEVYNSDNQVIDLSGLPAPRLFGTHLPWFSLRQVVEQVACKVVYFCRNPKDTFASLFHFTNKLRTEDMKPNPVEEMFNKFCSGVTMCGPYWDYVLEYWSASLESPDKVLFLRYEEMKEEPITQLRRLAKFLGYPFSHQEEESGVDNQILKLCSIDNLKSTEVNKNEKLRGIEIPNSVFFRRGEVGDWKNLLTPEMAQKLDLVTADKFEAVGLKV